MIGNLAGCLFGYLVMLRPVTASQPYALGALLPTWAFAVGLLGLTPYKYASLLACYTAALTVMGQVSQMA